MTESTRPKFKIEANPSFSLAVLVPRQGLPDAEVQVTYKTRSPKEMVELDKWLREAKPTDTEAVLAVATGWELDEPFTADTLATVEAQQPGFPGAVIKTYMREFERVRLGN